MPESVLLRIGAGETNAVAECLDRYGGLVWSLARRYLRNQSDAEDAVQEVFLDLWRSAARFDPARGTETTFVAMVARRRIIDRLRATGREQALPAASEEGAEREHRDPVQTPGRIEASLDLTRVGKALEHLRPERRRAVELAVAQGLSHQQVADEMKIPLGTAKTHVRRGLQELRERLASADGATLR